MGKAVYLGSGGENFDVVAEPGGVEQGSVKIIVHFTVGGLSNG